MAEFAVGSLVITMELISTGVGYTVASSRILAAQRAHRRMMTLDSIEVGGWSSWFLSGFSGVFLGTQWMWAMTLGLLWIVAGLCLVLLGIGLFPHV